LIQQSGSCTHCTSIFNVVHERVHESSSVKKTSVAAKAGAGRDEQRSVFATQRDQDEAVTVESSVHNHVLSM
jgi:hypothetical protein